MVIMIGHLQALESGDMPIMQSIIKDMTAVKKFSNEDSQGILTELKALRLKVHDLEKPVAYFVSKD